MCGDGPGSEGGYGSNTAYGPNTKGTLSQSFATTNPGTTVGIDESMGNTVGNFAKANAKYVAAALIPGGMAALALSSLGLKPGKPTKGGKPPDGRADGRRKAIASKAVAAKMSPALTPTQDTLGVPAAPARSKNITNRRSNVLTGSQGILGAANVGKTLLGS